MRLLPSTRFAEPASIEEAERRIVGTPVARGLAADIADIEAQLGDETKKEHTPEYLRWRANARRVLRYKHEELRYLRAWIKRMRVSRKILVATDGVSQDAVSLLKAARAALDDLLDDSEDRTLLHAIDLYLQHRA